MSRGMKQYLPFKSLHEQNDALNAMFYARGKKEKPTLSTDQISAINERLINYHGEQVLVTIFVDGYIQQVQTTIKKIDLQQAVLRTKNGVFSFNDLLNIEPI